MGNVSSSGHDKANGLLSRRTKKRVGSSIGRIRKQRRQQGPCEEYSHPHQPNITPLKESASIVGLAINPTRDIDCESHYSQVSTNGYRPTSFPGPSNMASQPMQSDGVSSKRFSESQAEFYSMAGRTEYPRWTAESPTTTFSTASSTIIASPTSPTFNSLTNHDVTSAQEKLPTFNLTQIVIPQRQLSRQDKHEDTSGLGACQTNTSISPRRRDEDDHSHFYQQQRGFTTDIQLLGTSPEAKEWLKQKPTRSTTTRLIHQYNFQNYQQYQPQRNPLTSVNNSRIISSYPQAPVLLRANTNPSMVRGSEGSFEVRTLQPIPKQRPNSITSDAATATTIATTATPIGEKLECHQGSVDLQEHTTQRHFDGHFYNHGCDISSCHNNLTLQSCGKGPQVGHLVMSRSKINSSVGLPESENL